MTTPAINTICNEPDVKEECDDASSTVGIAEGVRVGTAALDRSTELLGGNVVGDPPSSCLTGLSV